MLGTSSAPARRAAMPSGMPIGKQHAFFNSPGNRSIEVITVFESVSVSVSGPSFRNGVERGASAIPSNLPATADETITRLCLSGLAARRLSPNGKVSLDGRDYSALKASGSNTRYIDLAAWTSAHGLLVSTGQDGTVKSFTKAGTLWIVPLASNKIKKGSAWQTLPDIVMQKDGKTMIPTTGLSN